MKPRIAIPVPTSANPEYNLHSWPQYARAVSLAGGEPFQIEIDGAADLRALIADCRGILLPGSPADVRPSRYGAETDPQTAPPDLAREECDDFLLDHAERTGKPVLSICFGMQSMNVWRGGSLVQDVLPLPVNHAAGREVAIAHSVLVAPNTVLSGLLEDTEVATGPEFLRLPVNTSHHQAVAAPGQGLRIVARCPEDGVIEAIELEPGESSLPPRFMLGVQWHPERSAEISQASRALFLRLIAEAQRFAEAQGAG